VLTGPVIAAGFFRANSPALATTGIAPADVEKGVAALLALSR